MDWKKLGRRMLFPHPAATALLAVASAALLIYSFADAGIADAIRYFSYALSFYALLAACLRAPDMLEFARRFRSDNKYYLLYSSDVRLRMNVSLYGAFAFNAAYAVFQLCLGLWHASAWFYAMAAYYLLLATMRLMLANHTRTYAPGEQRRMEWKKYRRCGVLLLVMNLALAVIIPYFVWQIRVFAHHEITTIAMATYTFASLTVAIVNVVRYRRFSSPAYSAAKAVSLASAAVSLLTLENAMLTAFGQESGELFRRVMLGATGTAVVLFVQGMALYMIVNARRKLKYEDWSCEHGEQ